MNEPNRRILVIDDNRAIHDDLARILRGLGAAAGGAPVEAARERGATFALSSAFQGDEGVALARTARAAGRPYALALVDLQVLPGTDGLETIARLWAIDAELQVVVCTAYVDTRWQDIARRFGATARLVILKKPFDVVEVCQLALAMTEKWQLAHDARDRMAELVQSRAELERVASVGRLAAGVGHEINNPLTYVLGNVENLLEASERLDSAPPLDELIERLNEARDGLLRIRVIVRDLHSLTRSDAAPVELDERSVVDERSESGGRESRGDGEPVAPAVVTAATSVAGARQAKVLVIDDEPLIARILERALSRHQVVVASQAREALARIEQGETFDVILCDLMMPDVSGIDVHEYLSREHPAIARRMVFMTGGAFSAKAKLFLSGVTNERIDKPFSLAQVTQLVERYVDARHPRRRMSSGYGRSRVP